jgi:anti-sigma regulatory factor (Ser/Thr protein kinase)
MIEGSAREIILQPTPHAPRAARKFVARMLDEMGCPNLIEDAELMASELVTNSLRFAPGQPIVVNIWQAGPSLFLEIWDRSPQPPMCLTPDELAENGRGLQIVRELSLRYGYADVPNGKVVWVLLAVMEDAYLTWRCGCHGAPASIGKG